MAYKRMFRSAAREKSAQRHTTPCHSCRSGPKSKSVLIQQWSPPLVCNDGVTIARSSN
jgi:chaperonin GroEL